VKFPGATHRVFCFQYEEDAKNFYAGLIERLAKFNLETAEDKTKIISLHKDENDDEDKGKGCKPDNSFDFLGFTHYVGTDKDGRKRVKRKTSRKKYKLSLLRVKIWLKKNRHTPVKELMRMLNVKILGTMRYYGITDNRRSMSNLLNEIKKLLFKWLNRRSQRRSFDWDKFNLFLARYPLPTVKTYVRIFDPGAGSSYVL